MPNINFDKIYNHKIAQQTIKELFNDDEIEIIQRPASYIIKLVNEQKSKVSRIILLPPEGFTANSLNETGSHPEARNAKIIFKGAIRENKQAFSILKDSLKFSYFTKKNIPVKANAPYAKIDRKNKFFKEEIKSAKTAFFVVKENGEGFYHNLINMSDDWLLLILQKNLRFQKQMKIDLILKHYPQKEKKEIEFLLNTIKKNGDNLFKQKINILRNVLTINPSKLTPPLIEALNMAETGKHEPCTVYAIIMKMGKKHPSIVLNYLHKALIEKNAPDYYLKELIKKLRKS